MSRQHRPFQWACSWCSKKRNGALPTLPPLRVSCSCPLQYMMRIWKMIIPIVSRLCWSCPAPSLLLLASLLCLLYLSPQPHLCWFSSSAPPLFAPLCCADVPTDLPVSSSTLACDLLSSSCVTELGTPPQPGDQSAPI